MKSLRAYSRGLNGKRPNNYTRYFSRTAKLLQTQDVQRQLKQIFDNESYWTKMITSPSSPGARVANIPKIPSSSSYQNLASKLNIFHKDQQRLETGLFRNPYLTSSEGLEFFTTEMLAKAENIVNLIVSDTSDHGLRHCIKNLDTLSDMLCKVIDLCEFIRISHPDSHFLESAQKCHEKMFNYMNVLNTNVELFNILNSLLNDPSKKHIKEELSAEEVVVGELLLADFKKSGIDKDDKTRDLFIELSSRISVIGQYFNNNAFDLKDSKFVFSKAELKNSVSDEIMDQIQAELGKFSSRGTRVSFSVNSHVSFLLLKNCSNESIRKQIWVGLNSSSQKQLQLLELMLNYRKLLSLKLNYQDFNHYQLEDKMARNSNNVLVFLDNLRKKIEPYCVAELRKLADLKIKDYQKDSGLINFKDYSKQISGIENKLSKKQPFSDDDVIAFIRPWDREYLINQLLVNKRRKELLPETNASVPALNNTDFENQPISNFFSLGTIFANLSKFLTSIYGVKFKFDKPLRGEIWHKDVRKLLVVNAKDENDIIGIIYLDLFERLGKSLNPAHFTIVCSRKVTDGAEIENCEILNEPRSEPKDDNVKYIQCIRNAEGEIYQLPIITLVCNFSKSVKSINNKIENIALLKLVEVETLLHEIGHSLHSMFGKTNLHNVSGTRCLTDFVELPSILMETFSKDARVLKFLSEHYEDQFKIDAVNKQLEDTYKAKLIKLHQSENDVLRYCDIYSQLKMAYLDQHLYLETPNPVLYNPATGIHEEITEKNNDLITLENLDALAGSNLQYSETIYHNCEKDLRIFADLESSWYGKFGHLFTYGATYYTYLFDRAISSKIYKELFLADPFNNVNGNIFKSSVLRWGGSRNPWECVGECLNDPRIAKGDAQSMKLIGEIDDVK
ncbi:metalloendopeptidase [Saccharomycopsis crataegensis]|uniref:Mitochondrial intermediate peptidase n=1 Tax=Saccharomycopsis crataegensis TaxID=43959 RepID=A0AAV5QDM1_9ASCO|nr:metalloendopeptidase [Saccharomycopsis crataegensis]